MLIAILMFIFAKFLSPMFFGQIWSHNLDFFKFTKISLRGTLLHAHCSFNVYFFKILLFHIFWANLVPKSEVLQIYWNLVQRQRAICFFDFNVYFFKIFVIHIFLANLLPKLEVLQNDWNFVEEYIAVCLLRF